jgi:hypothetical protein
MLHGNNTSRIGTTVVVFPDLGRLRMQAELKRLWTGVNPSVWWYLSSAFLFLTEHELIDRGHETRESLQAQRKYEQEDVT